MFRSKAKQKVSESVPKSFWVVIVCISTKCSWTAVLWKLTQSTIVNVIQLIMPKTVPSSTSILQGDNIKNSKNTGFVKNSISKSQNLTVVFIESLFELKWTISTFFNNSKVLRKLKLTKPALLRNTGHWKF